MLLGNFFDDAAAAPCPLCLRCWSDVSGRPGSERERGLQAAATSKGQLHLWGGQQRNSSAVLQCSLSRVPDLLSWHRDHAPCIELPCPMECLQLQMQTETPDALVHFFAGNNHQRFQRIPRCVWNKFMSCTTLLEFKSIAPRPMYRRLLSRNLSISWRRVCSSTLVWCASSGQGRGELEPGSSLQLGSEHTSAAAAPQQHAGVSESRG